MRSATGGGRILRRDPEAPGDSDAIDAALAASGDARAFERLYLQHVARVHTLARRMVGPDDAAEATQDVFVRVWQKLDTFRGEAAFGTWLHRVAVNVILGRRAVLGLERQRFVEDEEALAVVAARPQSPGAAIDFESAIALLPPGSRQVFVLHDVEGYKHEEIGELLGISPGTSKAQLHRARMALRKHLNR